MAGAYVETAPSGRIVRVDDAFCTLTGRTEEELVGHLRFVDVLWAGSQIVYEVRLTPLLDAAGAVTNLAVDIRRTDGMRVPVLVSASAERTASGQTRLVRYTVRPTEG
ncbi:MAG TPA: PAS domain-containing protein [Mycobacteriales bacterium]|nr:PAS domain-containing protein [Mycobacteriales bacterium]